MTSHRSSPLFATGLGSYVFTMAAAAALLLAVPGLDHLDPYLPHALAFVSAGWVRFAAPGTVKRLTPPPIPLRHRRFRITVALAAGAWATATTASFADNAPDTHAITAALVGLCVGVGYSTALALDLDLRPAGLRPATP